MYVTLLVGMMVSALVFGMALADFSPGRLVQVIQGAAVCAIVLNAVAMWKQEPRRRHQSQTVRAPDPTFRESWATFCESEHAVRRLVIVGLGTMAFGMADVLLEPYGGQVLNWSVSATTKLTALLALGGLLGFAYASHALRPGSSPYSLAQTGALIGLPAFGLVIIAGPLGQDGLFLIGNLLIGFGAAIFGHATLTATMNSAPKEQAGLALGAWGAVQATAAGIALAMSGTMRDLINLAVGTTGEVWGMATVAIGYIAVYALEIALLVVTIVALFPLMHRAQRGFRHESAGSPELAFTDGMKAIDTEER
jgi:BCD family chlorophyll transporter-like MFS transporter